MAKALYNELSHTTNAEAAGTYVDVPGQTLQERKETSRSKNFFVLDVMKDVGLDISHYTRKPLTPDLADQSSVIISMASKDKTPEWLLESPKYTYWDVKDPRGQGYETTARVRDDIKKRIEQLINKGSSGGEVQV